MITCVAFSPNGHNIITGFYNELRVWDANTGEKLQGHIGLVTSESVAFSPYQIVSGSGNGLWVWDARTGERLRKLQGHTDKVNTVAFSPDGNRIVSGSRDNSVRVWDNLNLDTSWVVN